ncbi:hypothetical protein FRC18_006895, partial [Serendipita sp. 400]
MPIPLQNAGFTLDISGVAGFFGGDEVLSAMGTIHFYRGRKYLGWYNAPGSYTVAKKYGRLAKARFWRGLFPGDNVDINKFLGFDGETGPAFLGAHSGTRMTHTGYIAHLMMSECGDQKGIRETVPKKSEAEIAQPETDGQKAPPQSCSVSVAGVSRRPEPNRLDKPGKAWLAAAPILASAGTAATCAYFRDWYCFSMILLGMLSSGVACYAAGRGTLAFRQPKPSARSPPGNGVLYSGDKFVVLVGDEESVSAVTRGRFSLSYGEGSQHHRMGFSSLLLTIQFLLQLLLIPQGTLFGQLMFLVTFICSWVYNCYLSSIDKEEVQRSILMAKILKIEGPGVRRYTFTKRTTAVVFLLLVLQARDKEAMLNELLPNNTKIWKTWKDQVLKQLGEKKEIENPANDWSEEEK